MQAYKCDRCGKFYTNEKTRNYANVQLTPYRDDYYKSDISIDLCKDCMDELCKFLHIEMEKETPKSEHDNDKGLAEIKLGDKLKCIDCGKTILVSNKTFTIDENGEYISCPHCKKRHDIQVYHLYGEKAE